MISLRLSSARSTNFLVALCIVCVLVALAILLHLMGQPMWCSCGLKLMTLDAWGSESSQNFVDPYTLSHVLHGVLFYALLSVVFQKMGIRAKLFTSFFIEVGWEILENSPIIIQRYREATASLGYTGDTILNSVSDVLFMLVGFWCAARLPWKWTLAIVLSAEILMLVIYRDNLTLNILMLLTPIDAIREWQMTR